MAERKFRWDCENFAGIAKISLCHSEIHRSPMLDPTATVPLATIPCILHPASGSLLFFFSYFLPALKLFIPGLLKLIEDHMKLMEINPTLVMIGLTR